MANTKLRHGVFLGPWHALDEDPTGCLRRDLELMEWLENMGFDEAWVGEHHSSGWEIIGSPELFIAAAAERTSRLRFGTGVISLPYHNPLMVADRMVQLDHQTMGRVMFGVGPGLLVSDAMMLGVPPEKTRERMVEALEVILRLLDGEIVSKQTDWFDLREARLQLLPFTRPRPEMVVPSVATPSGATAAGRYGLGMLCLAASDATGYEALGRNWSIACEAAEESGRDMDRSTLRLVAPMHLADTREKARENVRFGLVRYLNYADTFSLGKWQVPAGVDPVDFVVDMGYAVIGTPDDAIEMLERMVAKQGDFGCFLNQAFDWADWAATKRSFELYSRYVIPHFSQANVARSDSYDWVHARAKDMHAKRLAGDAAAFAKHAAARESK